MRHGNRRLSLAVSAPLQPTISVAKVNSPRATFGPARLLRAEGAAELAVSLYAYAVWYPENWWLYGLLFLAPDVSLFLFAFQNMRLATHVYNALHNEVGPLLMLGVFLHSHSTLLAKIGLIWLGHISFDRVLVYGLEYPNIFRFTHLQASERINAN